MRLYCAAGEPLSVIGRSILNSIFSAVKSTMTSIITIGWREWVELPELGEGKVKAKVDTGARSSSLHAEDLVEFEEGGLKFVRFRVFPEQKTSDRVWGSVAQIVDYREVRSSNGQVAIRPVIVTPIVAMGHSFSIEITLAARGSMKFRMLLGREAIRGRFQVDPGRSFLGGRRPGNKARKKRNQS
jgi:hypothetical protein